jgi:hypothetical protein
MYFMEDHQVNNQGTSKMPHQSNPNRIWVSARQLRNRYGNRSHMWVERRLKFDADFPRPIKMGRLRFWDLDLLEAWERRRIASS